MGINVYVKAQNDSVLERLFDTPPGSLERIRHVDSERRAAQSTLDLRADEAWLALDARYNDALIAIHPNAPALAAFDDDGLGRVNASRSQLAAIGSVHGKSDDDGCGLASTKDGMLAVLALQRSKYDDFTGFYLGFTDESLAQHALRHERLCDKIMLAVADGQISEIYWY